MQGNPFGMYPQKSGLKKRQERMAREAWQQKGQAEQQTLFKVGLLGPNIP